MIIGIGSDLIDIRRIEQTIDRHGERFLQRIFTRVERAKSDKRAQRAASYAKRFAAKEACAKALGTGLRRGVFWRDMGVVNLPGGKPTMTLSGPSCAACPPTTIRTTMSRARPPGRCSSSSAPILASRSCLSSSPPLRLESCPRQRWSRSSWS